MVGRLSVGNLRLHDGFPTSNSSDMAALFSTKISSTFNAGKFDFPAPRQVFPRLMNTVVVVLVSTPNYSPGRGGWERDKEKKGTTERNSAVRTGLPTGCTLQCNWGGRGT